MKKKVIHQTIINPNKIIIQKRRKPNYNKLN
jgi:hypothetical protein